MGLIGYPHILMVIRFEMIFLRNLLYALQIAGILRAIVHIQTYSWLMGFMLALYSIISSMLYLYNQP